MRKDRKNAEASAAKWRGRYEDLRDAAPPVPAQPARRAPQAFDPSAPIPSS